MRVLYVSKALVTAAYRDKLRALAEHVHLRAVMPDRWRPPVEEPERLNSVLRAHPVLFAGHNHLHLYRRPAELFADPRPDLVHIDEEPYSAATFQLMRHCRARGIPALFFAWQTLNKRLPPPFGAMRRFVLAHARGAIAGTETAAQVLRELGYHGPLAVIPQFGVNVTRFAPDAAARRRMRDRLRISDDRCVVGFAGRLVPEKGVHVLLDAVRALPAVSLIVIGDGAERLNLERRALAGGLGDRVRFAGLVSSQEIPAWLNALDVVVLPSLTSRSWAEQFGRVAVEAMACGVAVVGSDSGEVPAVIGAAGMVVAEGDAGALAIALRRLAEDAALRASLARGGRERVIENYTTARVVSQTVEFYRLMLGKGERGSGKGECGSP